jgi:dTDP-4-amino-4,6-dideoxygalactose transaminase
MINVTKTYLPPLEKFNKHLEKVWESGWITNHGPLVLELEEKLKEYFGIKHLFFVTNGTIALQIALKAARAKGEVITTPFSYVATTSSIVWEGCTPVFVDIDPDTFTINPELIESAITPLTSAILATHVYGLPCNIEMIEKIAKRHKLKVIYDAAHAFGVTYKGRQLASYGDISTLSFHATKLFHTVEGGAILTNDSRLAHEIEYMRKFGHNGPEEFWGLGINGKNCELHAAMGLCIFPEVKRNIDKRKEISNFYYDCLDKTEVSIITTAFKEVDYNYSYLPILLTSEDLLFEVIAALNEHNVFPRRYFYPSLNNLPYLNYKKMPVSEDISSRVLCLPLYEELELDNVRKISFIINKKVKEWAIQYS